MKVFMLGWEFPPMVSGGLGVACYGLVKSLNAQNVDVMFVLPKPLSHNGHGPKPAATRQIAPATSADVRAALEDAHRNTRWQDSEPQSSPPQPAAAQSQPSQEKLKRVTFIPINSPLQPYFTAQQYQQVIEEVIQDTRGNWVPNPPVIPQTVAPVIGPISRPFDAPAPGRYLEQHAHPPSDSPYAGDLFAETARYARLALGIARNETFDIVHAHDWMTFDAAMAVSAASGKSLVIQIHSTEIDRAGDHADTRIFDVEKKGMLAAAKIVAVSQKTKTQLVDHYGIDPQKIEVVYNAADPDAPSHAATKKSKPHADHKLVLFLGRLAQQKGPDLFLHAAKKVLSVEPHARFVVAGQGEMLDALKDLSESLNIRDHVTFTGFLNKKEREKNLGEASVYVMPSVSEPFGISSLDALAHDVPVIISKQSGVAEVLKHVLKVDFWDTEDLANKILAVLHHPSLAATLREQGHAEARQLSWDESAAQIITLYRQLTRHSASRAPRTAAATASSATSRSAASSPASRARS